MRAIASTEPPARNGTTTSTCFDGNSCAKVVVASASAAHSAPVMAVTRRMVPPLLRFRADLADDVAPALGLERQHTRRLLGARAHDFRAELTDPPRGVRILERADDIGVDPGDDGLRRPCRRG